MAHHDSEAHYQQPVLMIQLRSESALSFGYKPGGWSHVNEVHSTTHMLCDATMHCAVLHCAVLSITHSSLTTKVCVSQTLVVKLACVSSCGFEYEMDDCMPVCNTEGEKEEKKPHLLWPANKAHHSVCQSWQ